MHLKRKHVSTWDPLNGLAAEGLCVALQVSFFCYHGPLGDVVAAGWAFPPRYLNSVGDAESMSLVFIWMCSENVC